MTRNTFHTTALVLAAACATPALAHDGRRFQVEVVDNQLVARGLNTQNNAISPGGQTTVIDTKGFRPYTSANHGHWTYPDAVTTLVPGSTLPGYDLGQGADALAAHDLTYTITGAFKWTGVSAVLVPDPTFVLPTLPAFVPDGTVPNFEPLAPEEEIRVAYIDPDSLVFSDVTTDAPGGTLPLVNSFDGVLNFDADGFADAPGSNGYDIDVTYAYFHDQDALPVDTLYVIESTLSTTAPGVADSDTIYTILSPDGANPAQRLHFAALYVEAFLGTFLPGDANGDGVVDLLDFDVLAQSFGQGPGFLGGPSGGDFNADGAVNLLDFDLLAQNFGASNPATIPSALPGALSGALPRALSGALPGAVPEPASAALLVLAGSLLARGRRRRRTA